MNKNAVVNFWRHPSINSGPRRRLSPATTSSSNSINMTGSLNFEAVFQSDATDGSTSRL